MIREAKRTNKTRKKHRTQNDIFNSRKLNSIFHCHFDIARKLFSFKSAEKLRDSLVSKLSRL